MLRWYFAFCIVATGLVLITQSVVVPERVGQQKQPAEKLSPILVLPGLMGSSLVIQRGAEKPPSPCYLGPKWQQLWINIDTVLNWVCFEKYMSLLINPDATTSPVPFANVTVPEGIWATAYLDPDSDWSRKKSEYLAHFYSYMQNLGYKLRHNLDAAPYDWRQSPLNYFKPGDFFEGLTARVERMFHQNGGQRVTLVGHSMGGAVGALFLSSYASLEWKEKHIRRFVSVAGVYGGSLKALAGIMDGLNITFGAAELLRSLARKIPGLHSLVPISNQHVDLWKNQTLFAIGDYEYTTDMFPELWTQMGMSEYFNVLNQLRDVGWQKPPKVETFCALSLSFPTIEGIHIKSTRPIDRDSAKFFYGDGDGTVPRKSLTVCSNWSRIQDAPVRTAYFSSDHFDMMHADQNVWSFIFNVTNNDPLL